MKHPNISAAACLTAFLAALSWVSPAAAEPAFDGQQLRRLKAGEVLISVSPDPEGATGLIEADIDIEAAPSTVWAIMLDCARSKRMAPSLKSCRVLSATPDGRSDVREHVVQWVWPLPPVRSVFRSDYIPFQRIAFQLVEGDLAYLQGSWTLEPLMQGTATRLSYRARITPGWPVPGPLVRSAIEADVPKTLLALRREVTGRD